MKNSNVLSYDTFLHAKIRNEVKNQVEFTRQFIAETREFIERSRLAKIELQYFSACTIEYLNNPLSLSTLPHNEIVEAVPGNYNCKKNFLIK